MIEGSGTGKYKGSVLIGLLRRLRKMIDVGFDFTSDSPGYWDKFWENNDGLGGGVFGIFGEGRGVCGEEG